jgi:hypothetical protein
MFMGGYYQGGAAFGRARGAGALSALSAIHRSNPTKFDIDSVGFLRGALEAAMAKEGHFSVGGQSVRLPPQKEALVNPLIVPHNWTWP